MSDFGNIKANAPTSPGWIWAKNMGLGRFGVINWQKLLSFGLNIHAVILTLRDLSIYGPGEIWEMARKIDSPRKISMSDIGNTKSQHPH